MRREKLRAKEPSERQAIVRDVLMEHTVVRAAAQIPLLCPKLFHPYAPLARPKYHLALKPDSSCRAKKVLPPIQAYQEYHVSICRSCQDQAVHIFRGEVLRLMEEESSKRAELTRDAYCELRRAIESCGPSESVRAQLHKLRELESDQRRVIERNSFFFFESLRHVWKLKPNEGSATLARLAEHLMHSAAHTTKEQSKRLVAKIAKWEQETSAAFATATHTMLEQEASGRRDVVTQWLNATAKLLQLYRADESSTTSSIRKRIEVERARHFAKVVGSDVIEAGRTVIAQEEADGWKELLSCAALSLADVRRVMFAQRVNDIFARERASRERAEDRSLMWLTTTFCEFTERHEELVRPSLVESAAQCWAALQAEHRRSQGRLSDSACAFAVVAEARTIVDEVMTQAFAQLLNDTEAHERGVVEHNYLVEERHLWEMHPKYGRTQTLPSPRQTAAMRQLSRKEAAERCAICESEGSDRHDVCECISHEACAALVVSSLLLSADRRAGAVV